MKLCDKMRLQHTQRWTIVPTTRPQSVAEHSFNVAIIVEAMMAIAPVSMPTKSVITSALMHDSEEAILGDMPTPTKSKMRDLGFDPSQLDAMVSGRAELLPIDCRYFLKAADLLDSIHFLTNFGTGKRAAAVLKQLNKAYDTMIVNVHHALTMLDEQTAHKMALVLHEIREQVMSEDWTE